MCDICEKLHQNIHVLPGMAPEDPPEYQFAGRVAEAEAKGMTLPQFMKGKNRWGSLHSHSEYSLLDGGAKVQQILDKAKAMGQDFVAITDHGNMFGAMKAQIYAKKIGIKHIIGCELYMAPYGRSRFDKDFKKGDKSYTHQIVLAKNKVGYHNLSKLSSLGFLEGGYRKPRIDRELLEKYHEGLIVTTSCIGGAVPQLALEGRLKEAEKEFCWLRELFGSDFYVEHQNHNIEIEKRGFEFTQFLANKYSVPTVLTTDAHYLEPWNAISHDALLCIGTGDWVDNPDRRFKFEGSGYWYHSEEEVAERFPGMQEAMYNTGRLADTIDDEVVDFGDIALPSFPIPKMDPAFEAYKSNDEEISKLWQPASN